MENLSLPIKKHIALILVSIVIATFSLGCSTQIRSAEEIANQEQVILIHGLGRSSTALWWLAYRLEREGFNVHRVDYDSFRTSPEEIMVSVEQQIESCCLPANNTIHFVGHSLGGLIIRAYLDNYKPDNLGQVLLLGTPNQGTDFVDAHRESWWMKLAGETALALGTGADSFPKSLPTPDYPVGVIAAYRSESSGKDSIPGPDDGLVPVESTVIDKMNDFILIESGHSAMRYNPEIVRQTIHYLRHSQFQHNKESEKRS